MCDVTHPCVTWLMTHVPLRTGVYMCISIIEYVFRRVCACVCVCVCVYIFYMCTNIYVCIYMCVYVYLCMYVYICMYVRIYIYMYI